MFLFWWKRSDSWFQLKLQKAWALEVSLGVEGCFFWYQLISTLFFYVELGVSSEEAKHSQFKSIRGANGYFFPKKMSGWLSRLGCVCVLITLTTGLGTNKTRWRRGCCVEAKAMWQPRMEELSRLQAFLHTTFHGCFFLGEHGKLEAFCCWSFRLRSISATFFSGVCFKFRLDFMVGSCRFFRIPTSGGKPNRNSVFLLVWIIFPVGISKKRSLGKWKIEDGCMFFHVWLVLCD